LALADFKAVAATDPAKATVDLPNIGEYRPVVNGEVHNYASDERDRTERDEAIGKLRNAVAAALGDRCLRATIASSGGATLADCNAALAIAPDFPVALAARGFAEFLHGDYRSAVSDLERAPPEMAPAAYLRGVARHRLGDKSRGDADIAEAEKLKPGIMADMTAQGLAP
jgi:hypothetical protein